MYAVNSEMHQNERGKKTLEERPCVPGQRPNDDVHQAAGSEGGTVCRREKTATLEPSLQQKEASVVNRK